jgi:hypothetical protein
MSVTAIRAITNVNLSQVYVVKNLANPNDTGGNGQGLTIAVGTAVQCNMWIPWCASEKDWANRQRINITPIAINVFPILFNIWQHGDYIRYSKDGLFHSDGDIVPGNSTIGRNCTLEITGTSFADADLRFY